MNRLSDIRALFDDCDSNLKRIDERYNSACSDELQKDVLKPLVKSTMEHLRSILEYSAQDIWESYTQKKGTPMFPYGADEEKFVKSLSKNLPGLAEKNPDIFSLVVSIQPHSCGDTWLYDLCKHTNFNKHDRLKPQVRKDSPNSTVIIGNVVRMWDSTVSFHDVTLNGVRVGDGRPVFVSNSMSSASIKEALGDIDVEKKLDWVEFHFEDSIHDVRRLLAYSRDCIDKYIAAVYRLL